MEFVFHKCKPTEMIALSFGGMILFGTFVLMIPGMVRDGVPFAFIDALFTTTSAVCVTGLAVVDLRDTFTPLGQGVIAAFIQIGGLGVTSIGVGVILMLGKRVDLRGRQVIRQTFNVNSTAGLVRFLKQILKMTIVFELAGAVLSFLVFRLDYPLEEAVGISIFHSISAFNNSGYDILGGFQNLIPYRNNILLNLVTCGLIFFGGIGYLVIQDMTKHKLRFRKLSFHSKVVLGTSGALIVAGTILLMITDSISLLEALFHSVAARTAGFSTCSLGGISQAGLWVIMVLMFIGASPGSTGGGIKTSTFFVLMKEAGAFITNRRAKAFHYSISRKDFIKAAVTALLGIVIVVIGTFLMLLIEPEMEFLEILFEVTSAFGTVGLSTGITPELSEGGKILIVIIMYIGRIGPLTVASLWYCRQEENVSYTKGNISIG